MRFLPATIVLALLPCLASAAPLPEITVAHEGNADYRTVQEAVNHAPPTGSTIRIAPGTYREKLIIKTPNVHLIGTGAQPQDVVLTWADSHAMVNSTTLSASVTASGDGFEAENLTFENTWENNHERTSDGSQAVALLVASDRSVLDHVRLIGAQDTLYANSGSCREPVVAPGTPPPPVQTEPCNASREYFHDCYIEGHVDFIFGDATAVFDRCELHARQFPTVMFTAQSKHYLQENSGYTFLHCHLTGNSTGKVILGRPWRDYSTVTYYDTQIDQPIDPDGWAEWGGRLKTSTYREYKSHGPGVDGGHRLVTSPPLTKAEEAKLTPAGLLNGDDHWNPEAEVTALRALLKKR